MSATGWIVIGLLVVTAIFTAASGVDTVMEKIDRMRTRKRKGGGRG